jgi:hypothetical protein
MATEATLWNRIVTGLGLVCLAMTLLLLSPGVRAVHADGNLEANRSVDPVAEAAAHKAALEAEKIASDLAAKNLEAIEEIVRTPGPADIEVEPGIVVLNTRGYNYGPPLDALDPAALGVEADNR